MKMFEKFSRSDLSSLKQLIAEASQATQSADEARARAMALQARIDQADEVAKQLEDRTVGDLHVDVKREGLADRILSGEVIEDGESEARRRLHHNSIVSSEIARQRSLSAELRREQGQIERESAAARESADRLMNKVRSRLLSLTFDAANEAIADLIRDFLLPLYAFRSQCGFSGAPIDGRIGVVFDQTDLWRLDGTTARRIWPPYPGPVIPGFPDVSYPGIERDVIAALCTRDTKTAK